MLLKADKIFNRLIMEYPRSVGKSLSNCMLDGEKAAFRYWRRFHQNYGCHGNRKLPLTYNGEKRCLHANTFSFDTIFIQLAGNEDRHKISEDFGQIGPLPLELGALDHLNNFS